MATFRVKLGPDSHDVHVGSGLLARVGAISLEAGLRPSRVAIVADYHVARLYAGIVHDSARRSGFDPCVIEITPGESSKSLAKLGELYSELAAAELDRASLIIALGGGVVGDLAGFAAATYLRGIALIQVPTTLLAQVDSALGGKTAVNLPAGKNLAGAFHHPRAIVADIDTQKSLPDREFREGLAEVIKYGAILDAPFVGWLEAQMPAILARDSATLETMVERSLRHKAYVVENDARESALRQILNFGHTVGHALENAAGYGSYLHGEAIAIGMVAAARLSSKYAGLSADEGSRLERLIEGAGLPTAMPDEWRSENFLKALRMDKKRRGDAIEFVLLDRLGHALTRKLSFGEIAAFD
jgi:3-dehydroquinate synthase